MKSVFGATLLFILVGCAFILPSSAAVGPVSTITSPKYLSIINTTSVTNSVIAVTGTATASAGATVSKVEVSVNGGSWKRATGTGSWSFNFQVHTSGIYHIKSRATDSLGAEENPGDGVKVDVVLPSATYSVSGTVSYSGLKSGDVIVAAFTDPHFVGGNPLVYKDIVTTGAYSLDGVPAGTFYVGAVRTVVGTNGVNIQKTDPIGAYGGIVAPKPVNVLGNRTGINITMNDTSANPLYLPAHAAALFGDAGAGPVMLIQFEFEEPDPANPASSVTVIGPKISTPISLTYDSLRGRWTSWGGTTDVSLQFSGTAPDTWPVLPATYTFTATGGAGAGTRTSVVKSYMLDVPNLKTPSEVSPPSPPDVFGSVVFSWSPAPTALFYEIELFDPSITGNQQIWSSTDNGGSHNFTGHSFTYNGAALLDNHLYYFSVRARDVNDNEAVAYGGFTYHTSTDTIAPSSSITSPLDLALVTGDSLVTTGVSGTAADDIGGSGVQAVEVSIDGGTNWFTATDTSGDGSWSHWNIMWPPSGPPINGPLSIKSRAIDDANNFETPAAGITITIDKDKPTSAFTAPANAAIVTTAPLTITGTASDTLTAGNSGVGMVELSLDGGTTWKGPSDTPAVTDTSGNGSWSTWSYSLTGDGVYPLQCRATDQAGNVQSPAAARTVTLDTTPPTLTVNTPLDGALINTGTTASISGTASDATSGMKKVEVQVLNANTHAVVLGWTQVTGTTTWSYNWTLPLDGSYTINVRATDNAGLTTVNTLSVKVDKTKPTVTMTAPTAATVWIKGTSFNVTGTASDATSGVDSVFVKVDDHGIWTPVTSGTTAWAYSWPLPTNGPHTVQAKAVDKAGNFQLSAVVSVKVDSILPSSAITLPNNNAILDSASYVIKGTALDAYSGVKKVEISTDGGTTWPYTAIGTTAWSFTWNLGPLPATGSYTILSRTTDVAGNVEDTTSKTGVAVTVNKTMPISAIAAPVTGKALKGPAAITGTAFRGASATATSLTKVEVSTNGGSTWGTATNTAGTLPAFSTWSYAWTPTTEGPCALVSRATNNLGVEDITNTNKAAVNVIFDKTPPSTSITDPAGGANLPGPSKTISGTASDSGVSPSGVAKVEVSTNGGATWVAATGTSSWSYNWTLGADGLYTLKSRATDKAGNVTVSAPVSVRVDKTKPTVALTAPLNGINIPRALNNWSITGYPVTGTAADATGSGVQKVEVSTDNGVNWSQATGTTSWSYPWVLTSDGTYTVKARSTDNANNVSLIPAGNTVKVDGTPPIALLTQPDKNAILNGTSYVIKGTAWDNLSGVKKIEIAIDGGAHVLATGTTSWSYTWSLTNVPYGGHLIQYWVTDNVGNQSGEYDRSVTVDKTSPVSAVTAPAAGKALKGASATISGSATAGASGGTVTKVEVKVINANTNAIVIDWTQATGTTAWSYTWTPLPGDGSYNIVSRATNSVGHVEDTALKAGVTVTVDKTNPTSTITDPAGGAVLKGTTYSITGTASDSGSAGVASGVAKVEVSTNNGVTWVPATDTSGNGSWSTWSENWTLGVDGPYTLKSRATDKAGNVLLTGDSSVGVRVDKTRPTSAITSPLAGANISGASKAITGTAGDGATGSGVDLVEVGITPSGGSTTWASATDTSGNGSWSTWSYDWNPLPADGNYNIKTRATDNGGNVQIPGAGITVKVDNTLPAVAITAPADSASISAFTNNTNHTVAVTGTASDGGSGLLKVEVSFDGGTTWKPVVDTSGYPTSGKAPWTTWSYAWPVTFTGAGNITARATDKALNPNTDMHAVTVSPTLLNGTWNYTFTPVGGGSSNSGLVTASVQNNGSGTLTVSDPCHTVFSGTFANMAASLDTAGDACLQPGHIDLTFSDMKHATGTEKDHLGGTVLGTLTISRP